MEAKAYLKYARISPRKVSIVLDLIRNKPVDYAMDGGILHSAISVGVICPDKHERRFAQFISELN